MATIEKIRGATPEQWARVEELVKRLKAKAIEVHGSDSYSAMGRMCNLTHETIRRYNEKMVLPYDIDRLEALVKPLGMSSMDALGYILGVNETKDSRSEAIAYVRSLDPQERMAFVSEALAA
jgi:hypothetical protein